MKVFTVCVEFLSIPQTPNDILMMQTPDDIPMMQTPDDIHMMQTPDDILTSKVNILVIRLETASGVDSPPQ